MHRLHPLHLLAFPLLFVLLSALLALPAPLQGQGTALGVDADPTGNTATSLGTIDSCIEVSAGDTFEVDVFVQGVSDLLAWEVYLEFDPELVQVIDRDVALFQAANPGSDILDGAEQTPDDDGLYRLSAVDTADPPAPDSGSGVLARVTLEALGSGVSPLRLALSDLDDDGTPDQGPFLRNVDGDIIGDDTGDSLFDGPLADAEVAVDTNCPGMEDATLNALVIIGLVIGGSAFVALVGLAVLLTRRRRATT